MANQTYREAYEAAAKELESLLTDQERIEERILSLRKTMNALATLISQHGGKDKDFLDYAAARLRETIDTSLTNDIHKIVSASISPLTASEIRSQLKELGGSLAEHSNPLATIHSILNRLAESGRAHETVKDGKKAWERMSRMAEAFRKAKRLADIPPPDDIEDAVGGVFKKK
jgi:DNA repair exonuclease SbcCD ATPase subunit